MVRLLSGVDNHNEKICCQVMPFGRLLEFAFQFPMVTASVLLGGGHVRVGLEDNIYIKQGVLASSNAALVEKAARIIHNLGSSVASVGQARELLFSIGTVE